MPRNRGITSGTLRYLTEREGLVCYDDDIAAEIEGASAEDVRKCVSYLMHHSTANIERVAQGAYRFSSKPKPGEKPTSDLFEKVGESKTGKLVLQDEEGNLYVAEAL